MKEQILYGCKVGQPDYMETVIVENQPQLFEAAKVWALNNGYDRFRIATIDLSIPPNFKDCIKK